MCGRVLARLLGCRNLTTDSHDPLSAGAVEVVEVKWGADSSTVTGHFDWLIAADVLYEGTLDGALTITSPAVSFLEGVMPCMLVMPVTMRRGPPQPCRLLYRRC
jgi:hypothetical protein